MADVLEQFERIGLAQKLLLLIVILAALGAGFYFFALQPLEQQKEQTQRSIDSANEEAASLRAAADQVSTVRRELTEICELYTSVMDRLPRDPDFETLLRRVTGHGNLTDVLLTSGVRSSSSRQDSGGQYNTLSVALSLSGNYDQVSDFFHFLSRERRIINVTSVSLSSGGGRAASSTSESSAPRLTVSASIDTYYARGDARGRSEACENI